MKNCFNVATALTLLRRYNLTLKLTWWRLTTANALINFIGCYEARLDAYSCQSNLRRSVFCFIRNWVDIVLRHRLIYLFWATRFVLPVTSQMLNIFLTRSKRRRIGSSFVLVTRNFHARKRSFLVLNACIHIHTR